MQPCYLWCNLVITGATVLSLVQPCYHWFNLVITGATLLSLVQPCYHWCNLFITGATLLSLVHPCYHSSNLENYYSCNLVKLDNWNKLKLFSFRFYAIVYPLKAKSVCTTSQVSNCGFYYKESIRWDREERNSPLNNIYLFE